MASKFNTIHIFSFGTVQIIGEEFNKSVAFSELTQLEPFITYVKSLRPEGIVEGDFHVIHVFNEMDVRYLAKDETKTEKKSYIIKMADFDQVILNTFADEVLAKVADPVVPPVTP